MSQKDFKTLDEQIDILKNRGLSIKDEERAKKFLLSQNYYNIINGYAKFFPRTGDNYTNGTDFDEITSLYTFEREFKQTLLLAILEAEAHLRSIFSYRFAEMYPNDPYAYLNIKNYDNNKIENILSSADTISKLSQTINYYSKSQKDGSIAHYLKKYKNVPIWVLINYLNLGELRHMLSQSTGALQNKVAKDFTEFVNQNIPVNIKEPFHSETLNSLLKNINEVRNICAHNNRIIGFKCRQDAKYWAPLHTKYNINEQNERRSVYTVFISLQCFISKTEYGILHNTILKRIGRLSKNLHTISVNEILLQLGFPKDWHINENKIDQ